MKQPDLSRNAVTLRIRVALRVRSGKVWSVTGGRGSAYGWIYISRKPNETMTDVERAELARLLDLQEVHHQGVMIPASNDYRQEYLDRAEGKALSVIGTPYWD